MPPLYLARDSGLHRLHPSTKALLALASIVATLALPSPLAAWVLLGTVLLPLSLWGKVGGRFVVLLLRLLLPLAISLLLIQGLFAPGERVLWSLGPFFLKEKGVLFAFELVSRLAGCLGAALLFLLTTHPGALAAMLVAWGLSPIVSYWIVSALNLMPQLRAKAATIRDAQRARGLHTEGPPWVRLGALLPLIAPLVLGALAEVEMRAIALETRAFRLRGPKTSFLELAEAPWERQARVLLLGLLMLSLAGGIALGRT